HPLRRTSGSEPAVDVWIEVTIHHSLHVAGFDTGTKILYHAIGLEDVATNLVTPGDAALFTIETFHFGFLLVQALSVNFGKQHFHGGRAVLVLRTLILGSGDDTSRKVSDADGSLDLVNVLTAFPAGTVGVDLQFARRDRDIRRGLLNFGDCIDAGKAGVAA